MDLPLNVTSVDSLEGHGVARLAVNESGPELHEEFRRDHPHKLVKTSSFRMKDRWEEVDRGEHADALVTALKARNHGKEITKKDVEPVLIEQYPGAHVRPSYTDMDKSISISPSSNGLPFGTGQWAEYYGRDAQWHLGLIRRVLAKAPLDYRVSNAPEPKWEYSYNFGRGVNIPAYLVRAPEEALKRTFGMRPFVWLQYALLRVEMMVRFQEHHQRDFEDFNFCFAAESLWEKWLNHPDNSDFKVHFDSFSEQEQSKLVQHLLSTFTGLDRLSKLNAPGSRWDFKNQNISIYTYPSLLGSGWMSCAIVLLLQFAIPSLLLMGAVESSSRFNDGLFSTTVGHFCRQLKTGDHSIPQLEGLLMNLFVLLLYATRVLPLVLDTFYQTTGEGNTPASRLNALRAVVWNRGADTFSMQFGYRLERLVKSCYMCLVCCVMLFALFLSDSVLDIILNALAIEFVWRMDVDSAKSPYWDPKRRWIKAGAVECRIRATMELKALNDSRVFCKTFDIDPAVYKQRFNGEMPSLRNSRLAARDARDAEYMTETDIVWKWAGEVAKQNGLSNAYWQFAPHNRANLGLGDQLLLAMQLSQNNSVFRRFTKYRTWSLWEEVLFMSPIPQRNENRIATLPKTLRSTQEQMLFGKHSHRDVEDLEASPVHLPPLVSSSSFSSLASDEYLNFAVGFNSKTPMERFFRDLVRTLLFQSMWNSVTVAYSKRAYGQIPFRVMDGLVEWLSHLIQVMFPLVLVAFAALNITCY